MSASPCAPPPLEGAPHRKPRPARQSPREGPGTVPRAGDSAVPRPFDHVALQAEALPRAGGRSGGVLSAKIRVVLPVPAEARVPHLGIQLSAGDRGGFVDVALGEGRHRQFLHPPAGKGQHHVGKARAPAPVGGSVQRDLRGRRRQVRPTHPVERGDGYRVGEAGHRPFSGEDGASGWVTRV